MVGESEEIASLQQFAADFEQAFPGLHLAVGNELSHKHSAAANDPSDRFITRPLWAVHLGETGIQYNIREELPFFFSLAPLATTLLAGTVPISRYQRGAEPGAELNPRRKPNRCRRSI
ncbi:MAG: hypothetical protein HC866_23915, partial [Leptolyngbyaceae cyanobacterium RU_5_1]|nr:hypothetical protein [Leptolyngbyaceae cyanobacterium RU_5_1]